MFYAIAILTKLEAVTSIITTSNECWQSMKNNSKSVSKIKTMARIWYSNYHSVSISNLNEYAYKWCTLIIALKQYLALS
jgi:hypothetical protein